MQAIAGSRHSRTVAEFPQVEKRLSIAGTFVSRRSDVHGAQNRRKPILPSLVFRALIVSQSKRRAQRFSRSRKHLIAFWRTACVVLAKTMRRGIAARVNALRRTTRYKMRSRSAINCRRVANPTCCMCASRCVWRARKVGMIRRVNELSDAFRGPYKEAKCSVRAVNVLRMADEDLRALRFTRCTIL